MLFARPCSFSLHSLEKTQSANEPGVISSQIIYNGPSGTGTVLFVAEEVAHHALKSRPKIFIMHKLPLRILKGSFLLLHVFEHYAFYPGPAKGHPASSCCTFSQCVTERVYVKTVLG